MARASREGTSITVAGRFFLRFDSRLSAPVGSVWKDVHLALPKSIPPGKYRDVFTGLVCGTHRHAGRTVLLLADVFSHLPVSLLEHVP
jgi:maltooligosyltrehalose synthase